VSWLSDNALDIVGWGGSALLIYSVMQARVLRFRVVNLAACVVLTGFNAALGIWPMVAMNVALTLINLWHIRALLSARHDDAAFEVLEVGPADAYLRHVLRVHEKDILEHQPDLVWDGVAPGRSAFLVQRGDETVGVVLIRDDGAGRAQVELDWVSPRFRDFSPGEFVWRRSGLLREHGFRQVVTSPVMVGPYYERIGFHPDGRSWVLDL
jgi:hypothetical protein